MKELAKQPETDLFLIVNIDTQYLKLDYDIRTEIRKDRKGTEWKYKLYVIPPEMQSSIAQSSIRVIHSNLEIIPAMCVQAEVRQVEAIAEQKFVSQIELSTKAKLSAADSSRIVRATEVWGSAKGRDVVVSVVDTGINEIKPLKGKINDSRDWTFEGEHDTYLKDDEQGHYFHGHGTSVASIITYVAPEAQILNYKAIHPYVGKAGSSPDRANVIDAIKESVKSKVNRADVINLSLGFDPSQCSTGHCDLCEAVDNAVAAGLNVVAAVGNEKGRSPPDCPAQAREAISVAASTKSDTIWEFGSTGPTNDRRDKPDVVAPGSGILIECAKDGLESRAGTSFSAAFVSGVVALCREKTTFPTDIKDALRSKAVRLKDPNTGTPYHKHIQGEGRIDAKATYDYL